MSKCLICENLYPPHYKECPICNIELVKEIKSQTNIKSWDMACYKGE